MGWDRCVGMDGMGWVGMDEMGWAGTGRDRQGGKVQVGLRKNGMGKVNWGWRGMGRAGTSAHLSRLRSGVGTEEALEGDAGGVGSAGCRRAEGSAQGHGGGPVVGAGHRLTRGAVGGGAGHPLQRWLQGLAGATARGGKGRGFSVDLQEGRNRVRERGHPGGGTPGWPPPQPPHLEADAGFGEPVPVLEACPCPLPQGLEPALGMELLAQQGPHLLPLDGAQQDHGLCRQRGDKCWRGRRRGDPGDVPELPLPTTHQPSPPAPGSSSWCCAGRAAGPGTCS